MGVISFGAVGLLAHCSICAFRGSLCQLLYSAPKIRVLRSILASSSLTLISARASFDSTVKKSHQETLGAWPIHTGMLEVRKHAVLCGLPSRWQGPHTLSTLCGNPEVVLNYELAAAMKRGMRVSSSIVSEESDAHNYRAS